MTGRIANRLNLKGPNYLVDAALLVVAAGGRRGDGRMRAGRSRLMMAAASTRRCRRTCPAIFTQLGALSARAARCNPSRPAATARCSARGWAWSCSKRWSDALADGDRIHATLRGIGQASDGRGTGLLAPSVEGETLAIRGPTRAAASTRPAFVDRSPRHRHPVGRQDRDRGAAQRVRRPAALNRAASPSARSSR